jgi:hypothetical protein
VIRQQGSLPLAQLPCRKAVRRAGRALRAVTRPTPNSPGTFFVAQSWAGCITDMPRFNLRQAQATTELRPGPFRVLISSQDVASIDGKTRSSVVRTSRQRPR